MLNQIVLIMYKLQKKTNDRLIPWNTCYSQRKKSAGQIDRQMKQSKTRAPTIQQSQSLCLPFFFFRQIIALIKNCEKFFLFHLKSFLRSQDIPIFLFLSFSFSSCQPLKMIIKKMIKLNLKIYDVINWLYKNLKTHLVWYLEKESGSDIETWSIDRVLNKRHYMGRYAENKH